MKFINTNKAKRALMIGAILLVFACEDENKAPIVTFDVSGHGTYPRLVSETGDKLMNIQTQADFDASEYGYTIEFIDEQGGESVAEYKLLLEFEDNDSTNGDKSVQGIVLRTYTPADFTQNANGYLELANVNLTATELALAVGITYPDLRPGDNFNLDGEVHTVNGDVFTSANSSASIEGSAFRGHLAFQLPASCPTNLAGTYKYTTSGIWCNGSSVSDSTDIVDEGGGVYVFKDWSFGAYAVCYTESSVADQTTLTFTDVCKEVAFTGFVDSFGDTWTFSSSIDGNDWVINWSNTYGEAGNSRITFPDGVPFALKP